jgi:KDO2-lipid IV(A) lauroyltransferase
MDRIFRVEGWGADYLREHGEEGLRRRARRILFLTAHIGNWELASGYFSLLGVRIVPVYRATANPWFNRLLLRLRLESHPEFLERRGAVNEILARLERGENIGFLYDQEAVYGIYVPFFGVPLCTHKTPAVLQRDFSVRVFWGVMIRRGDFFRYDARGEIIEPPEKEEDREAQLTALTASLMRRLEEEVRRNPGQFLWMNRRWKRKERA